MSVGYKVPLGKKYYLSSKWIKGDVSRRILVLDTSLFIHFDDKYFRTEGAYMLVCSGSVAYLCELTRHIKVVLYY